MPSVSRRRPSAGQGVVVVTGASRGLGREVCKRFAALGAPVGMIARDAAALEEARHQITGKCHSAAADVSDRLAISAALADIEDALGPPSVLVNNAGHGQWGAVVDTPTSEFERAIEVNYLGAVYAIDHVVGGMLRRGEGHIVNVASIAGRIGAPFEAAYSASKFALVGYTEALAVELAGSGVNVSLIDPGPMTTGFFERRGQPTHQDWPRPLSPDRVAESIIRITRGGSREQFVPRWLRAAHAAKTLAPPIHRLGVRYMYSRPRRDLRNRQT